MMKRIRFSGRAAAFCLLLTSAICLGTSWYHGIFRMQDIRSVTVIGSKPLLSAEAIVNQLTQADADKLYFGAAGWNRLGVLTVREPGLQRELSAEVLETAGDIRLISPAGYLRGGGLTYQDGKGCVLSAPAAQALFQSIDVIGLPVIADEKTYYIRGVLDEKAPLLLLGTEQQKQRFQQLELSFRDQRNGWQRAKNRLSQLGVYQDYVLLDGAAAREITRNLALYPLWLLLLLGVVVGCRFTRRQLPSGWRLPVYLGILAAGGLLLWLCGLQFQIPDSMLPPKWSDFEFYSQKTNEIRESIRVLQGLPVTLPQLHIRNCMGNTSLFSALAVLSALSGVLFWRASSSVHPTHAFPCGRWNTDWRNWSPKR